MIPFFIQAKTVNYKEKLELHRFVTRESTGNSFICYSNKSRKRLCITLECQIALQRND